MAHKFKIVLVGDGGCGKTTLINRLRTGEFEKQYMPTMGVEVSPLTFMTNKGNVILNIWDCAGQERFGGHRDGYYLGAHAFIVMFDTTSKVSYKNARLWVDEAHKSGVEKSNLVLVGNKVDVQERKVRPMDITLHKELDCQYYDVSAKSNYNFEKPFLHLARKLMRDDSLVFVEKPAIQEERVLPTPRE